MQPSIGMPPILCDFCRGTSASFDGHLAEGECGDCLRYSEFPGRYNEHSFGNLLGSWHAVSRFRFVDEWLYCGGSLRGADAIFVLAGRENRKRYGLELFQQGLAPRILFSVARFEIRRFSRLALPVPVDLLKLASNIPPPRRHFFVLLQGQAAKVEHVRPGRFGTLTEIQAVRRWLGANPGIHSLLMVSNKSHLRRIGMCCDALLGAGIEVRLIAAPETSDGEQNSTPLSAKALEMAKIALYWVILRLRRTHRQPGEVSDRS